MAVTVGFEPSLPARPRITSRGKTGFVVTLVHARTSLFSGICGQDVGMVPLLRRVLGLIGNMLGSLQIGYEPRMSCAL